MKTVSKSQLKQWIDGKQDMLVVNVLSPENFTKQHISGSINIPLKENYNFADNVEAQAGSKNKRVVVYCANAQCDASQHAADKLEQAGFTDVVRYEEGVEGWFGKKSEAA